MNASAARASQFHIDVRRHDIDFIKPKPWTGRNHVAARSNQRAAVIDGSTGFIANEVGINVTDAERT